MTNVRLYWLVIGLLALSATAIVLIPWGPLPGMDLQNVDAFHDCAARDNPYLGSGAACGDILDRGMFYPPLLYWSFVWTRLLPFETAYALWVAVAIIGSAVALAWWVPAERRGLPLLLFGALLFLQYPMVLALERGNNDVMVLVLWTVSAGLLTRRDTMAAGFVAGVSVLLKLYPASAVLVTLAGLLRPWRIGRSLERPMVRYCIGGLIALLVAGVPFIGQGIDYLQDEARVLLGTPSALNPGTHGLHLIAPDEQGWLLWLPLLLVWGWASYRQMARDPVLVLAGALAISTYFADLSNDYNLVTTYPLLIVLFVRATISSSKVAEARLLLLGLIAIVGHRGVFLLAGWETGSQLHIWLQWIWLMATGLAIARSVLVRADEARGVPVSASTSLVRPHGPAAATSRRTA